MPYQVAKFQRLGVKAEVSLSLSRLGHHDRSLGPRVRGDHPQRFFEGSPDDGSTGFEVAFQLQRIDRLLGAQQRYTAARNDAFLDSCLRGMMSILDASFQLLHFRLCRRADSDNGDAAGQLGKALLEFLAVVIRRSLFDLFPDRGDAPGDLALLAAPFHDRRVVFVDDDPLSPAEIA